MESMTGYAFLEKSTEQFSFSVEIKSLNTKYLEVYVNLPKLLRNSESSIVQLLKKKFTRGKIELTVDIFDWNKSRPLRLNSQLIEKYYGDIRKIKDKLKIKEPISVDSLLGLEGVIQKERMSLSSKSMKAIDSTINSVIEKAVEMRKKEGIATRKDLLSSISDISGALKEIKVLSKKACKEKQNNLKQRLKSLLGGVDNSRIYAEIALLTDKLDINEEVVRLGDHIKKFKVLVKENGQVGRKLDFLAQEMFREINTISSKSSSSDISHLAIDVKNNIDKIREQCRNIV